MPKSKRRKAFQKAIDQANDRRANLGMEALISYSRATGSSMGDDDALVDIITDLMHWARRQGFDINAAIEQANEHFACEVEGRD